MSFGGKLMPFTELRHDPFARGSIVRETIEKHERGKCRYCGQPARFRYGWMHDDDPRPSRVRLEGQFCSIGCYISFGG